MDPTADIPSFWQYLSTMGVGGVLAAYAFYINNKNLKDNLETVRGWLETEKGRTQMLVDTITKVSVNLERNTVLLDALHKRLDRDADFHNGVTK